MTDPALTVAQLVDLLSLYPQTAVVDVMIARPDGTAIVSAKGPLTAITRNPRRDIDAVNLVSDPTGVFG